MQNGILHHPAHQKTKKKQPSTAAGQFTAPATCQPRFTTLEQKDGVFFVLFGCGETPRKLTRFLVGGHFFRWVPQGFKQTQGIRVSCFTVQAVGHEMFLPEITWYLAEGVFFIENFEVQLLK